MVREIALTQGLVALVDDADYEAVNAYHWHALSKARVDGYLVWYARRGLPRGSALTGELMHRFIMQPPKHLGIDHIDGNGLNNTRANLRLANDRENQANRRRVNGASRFRGVWATRGRWQARITVGGKAINLGCFGTEDEAAIAYDRAAIKYFGAFVVTNTPRPLLDAHDRMAGALARLIDNIDPLDWEQGICDWCGGGWEDVPGPRGGKPKHIHTGKHRDGCPFVEARAALAVPKEENPHA